MVTMKVTEATTRKQAQHILTEPMAKHLPADDPRTIRRGSNVPTSEVQQLRAVVLLGVKMMTGGDLVLVIDLTPHVFVVDMHRERRMKNLLVGTPALYIYHPHLIPLKGHRLLADIVMQAHTRAVIAQLTGFDQPTDATGRCTTADPLDVVAMLDPSTENPGPALVPDTPVLIDLDGGATSPWNHKLVSLMASRMLEDARGNQDLLPEKDLGYWKTLTKQRMRSYYKMYARSQPQSRVDGSLESRREAQERLTAYIEERNADARPRGRRVAVSTPCLSSFNLELMSHAVPEI